MNYYKLMVIMLLLFLGYLKFKIIIIEIKYEMWNKLNFFSGCMELYIN